MIAAYLDELARVLTPDGVAFLHHSNLGPCQPDVEPTHARARSVTADTSPTSLRAPV